MYGLSGASGIRPCLFCLATKSDMQGGNEGVALPCRDLAQLKSDYGGFMNAGSVEQY